jgi:hypothetical protein
MSRWPWPMDDRAGTRLELEVGQLGPGSDVEFAEHLDQVVLDGALADEEASGDFPIGEAFRCQPGDLRFLRGEVDCRIRCRRAGAFAGRFPGRHTVTVEGTSAAVLVRPRPERPAETEVTGIRPTADEVPVNLLRLYVWFSARMSEGHAAGQVRLARDDGSIIADALLPTEHELWDASRRRLTVLLDPARIKRGLPGHREAGYPLRSGEPFRLVVGDGFCDAQGLRLRHSAERRYEVGGEERRHVDPVSWELAVPPAGTCDPLQVIFGRPLDHGLLRRGIDLPGSAPRPRPCRLRTRLEG